MTCRAISFIRGGNEEVIHRNYRFNPLSAIGANQARECRKKMGDPTFDAVIHPPLVRQQQTARVVGGLRPEHPTVIVPELFYGNDDPDGQIIELLFFELRQAPLRHYFAQGGREALMRHGQKARRMIDTILIQSQASRILVVGHDILLAALGLAYDPDQSRLLNEPIGECEGFHFQFDDNGKAVLWQMLRNGN